MRQAITWILIVVMVVWLFDLVQGSGQLLGIVALVGFGFLAFDSFSAGDTFGTVLYGALALLFQPFYPIGLRADFWMVVQIVVALWLLSMVLRTGFRR